MCSKESSSSVSATKRLGFRQARVSARRRASVRIRRTVATGMQKLGVTLQTVEAVLGHTSGSRGGIVGIYQRHDYATEKRAALDVVQRRESDVDAA